jgi:hypothetical protein
MFLRIMNEVELMKGAKCGQVGFFKARDFKEIRNQFVFAALRRTGKLWRAIPPNEAACKFRDCLTGTDSIK